MKSILFASFIAFWSVCVQAHVLVLPLAENIIVEPLPVCTCEISYNEYDPSCGSNHFTYLNPTFFDCDRKCKNASLTIQHSGTCRTDLLLFKQNLTSKQEAFSKTATRCICTITNAYNPVCGSDGIIYDNLSLLHCEKKCRQPKLMMARDGRCHNQGINDDELPFLSDAIKRCDCSYTNERDPVCGTDGYTYPNPAALTCVSRCNNPSLRVVHYGRCLSDQKPHNFGAAKCNCLSSSAYFNPICAENGFTYDNPSMLYCAEECLQRTLKVVSDYPCRSR